MTKWLFCVAKNKIKNQRRKHYYQNEVSYTQYQKENRNEGEAAATAEIEERMVMQNCIQNLNPMDQRIFWGRAYGFSYKELSGFCKKSEQALQCQYSRAIKKLQGMMSQEISLTRAQKMEMVCSGNLNSYNLKTIEISKKFSAGEYPVSKNKVLPFTYQKSVFLVVVARKLC